MLEGIPSCLFPNRSRFGRDRSPFSQSTALKPPEIKRLKNHCLFSRAFGVASRFVDGFNSFQIEEFTDFNEGLQTFAIKYKNIYSWTEIYVPTDTSGNGKWVQFDLKPFDIQGGNYTLKVDTDNLTYSRPDIVNIDATLISGGTDPIYNQRITF